ncbi:MAG: hypothetical protein HOM11_02000 [Methylococcales bacterium]|jgi:hypothetical protein|nr:hypothetical protein [Methylococcales bacterium]MBT7445308.1 hypothetical protein [Methylococcales bacterium]
MEKPINIISKLNEENQALKREIKRLKLVNELNIVLFQDHQQQNEIQLTEILHDQSAPDLSELPAAANDYA